MESTVIKQATGKTTLLGTTVVMHEACGRAWGRLHGSRKAADMLQREEEKGERRGKEGDSWKNDRMGASFPPFHPRG